MSESEKPIVWVVEENEEHQKKMTKALTEAGFNTVGLTSVLQGIQRLIPVRQDITNAASKMFPMDKNAVADPNKFPKAIVVDINDGALRFLAKKMNIPCLPVPDSNEIQNKKEDFIKSVKNEISSNALKAIGLTQNEGGRMH